MDPQPDGTAARSVQVAVEVGPAHLDRPFDYAVPDGMTVEVGSAVQVPFAGRRRRGWVLALGGDPPTDLSRVRPIAAVGGGGAWFDAADLRLYRWVAARYAGSLADVLRHALPPRVARVEHEAAGWRPPPPREAADRPPCPSPAWRPYGASTLLRAVTQQTGGAFSLRALPGDDDAALVGDLVARCLAAGRSALLLVPDPSSAVAQSALALAGPDGVDLRRDDSPPARYRAFLRGRRGHLRVVAGERSAVFAPLPDLGLVVVADEANPAYKERRSPRHHARDVALARARMAGATAVLLGDLASAPAWRHRAAGHLTPLVADRAAERERAPHVEVVDRSDPRPGARRARFSDATARAMSEVVRGGGAVVVLAARTGQGTALACRGCGRRVPCPVCAGSVRDGEAEGAWRCPACGWDGPAGACPVCGQTATAPLAAGAGRLAQELARSHPAADVVRMEGFNAPGPRGRPAIAVMTRGSVVADPGWLGGRRADLVVIPDADAMLGRPTLDAGEDALRLWLAVARWAPRVLVQTREPNHPAVQALVRWDPDGFWRRESERRAELRYPPAGWLVRLVAPATEAGAVAAELRAGLPPTDEVLGPGPDGAVLVKSADLRGTLGALTPLRHAWGYADRRVRVDVDPVTTE